MKATIVCEYSNNHVEKKHTFEGTSVGDVVMKAAEWYTRHQAYDYLEVWIDEHHEKDFQMVLKIGRVHIIPFKGKVFNVSFKRINWYMNKYVA